MHVQWHKAAKVRASVISAFLLFFDAAIGQDAPPTVALTGLDGQQASITIAELDALPRVTLTVQQHHAAHVFEGALLGDVLKKVGAPSGAAIQGPELADVVVVQARDGYTVALDLAGTDAVMRPERVILADREDGAALPPEIGPFELVVEGDLRPLRANEMVTAIVLKRLR
jgi:hypothetical protein